MKILIDAQISPYIALWINESISGINAHSMRSLGMLSADDYTIFHKAKLEKVVTMTKDSDFIRLSEQYGIPPQIIWITAGNTSNSNDKNS